MRIIHEYNNLGSSASDGYKCELYNRYLDALNEYASAYAFSNYYEKANQTDYFRDYEKRDRKNIRNYVKEYLVPLLREVEKRYDDLNVSSEAYAFSSRLLDSNYDKLPKNYLFAYSKSLPKDMADIMNMPFEQDLILVGNKSTSANTAYVGRIGNQHFIYFNSSKMDLDTVVHELGHFYSDSVSGGYVSFDVGEVHSIANHFCL